MEDSMTVTKLTNEQQELIEGFISTFNLEKASKGSVNKEEIIEYLIPHFKGEFNLPIKPINNEIWFCPIVIRGEDRIQKIQRLYESCAAQNIKCYAVNNTENDLIAFIFFSEPIPMNMLLRFAENFLEESQITDNENSLGDMLPFCLTGRALNLPLNGKDWENNKGILLDPGTGFKEGYENQVGALIAIEKCALADVERIINNLATTTSEEKVLTYDLNMFNLSYFLNTITVIGSDIKITSDPDNLTSSTYLPVNPIDLIYGHISTFNNAGKPCYFCNVSSHEQSPENKNFTIKTLHLSVGSSDNTLSVEEQLKESKALLDRCLFKLEANNILQPSFIVQSGTGYDLYFVLKNCIPVNFSELQIIQNNLIDITGIDMVVHPPTQPLRIPFSLNLEVSDNPQQVTIAMNTGNEFILQDFDLTVNNNEDCGGKEKKFRSKIDNPIEIIDNNYYRIKINDEKEEEKIPISTFIIKPIESIKYNNKEDIKANLISEKGKSTILTIKHDAWNSLGNFSKIIQDKDYIFLGNSKDILYIQHLISKEKFPTKQGFGMVGLHQVNGVWTYITNTDAISINGKVDDVVYIGENQDFISNILETDPMPPNFMEVCLTSLPYFNEPNVVAPVLGFTVSCFFKPRLFKIKNSFPILFLSGEAGSGKTDTIRKIILAMHGNLEAEKMLDQMTKATFRIAANSSNSLPIFLDEYKPSKMKREMVNEISSLLRTSFNALKGDRARPDQSKKVFRYEAPIIIAGEDQFTEPAVLERIIAAATSKQTSSTYLQWYDHLISNFDLKSLGRLIVDKAVGMTDEEILSIYKSEYQQISPQIKDRLRDNVTIIRFGLHILNELFLEHTEKPFPITPSHAEESQRINFIENHDNQKSTVDKIVEGMLLQIEQSNFDPNFNRNYKLRAGIHYRVAENKKKEKELKIHLNIVYPLFNKWAKHYQSDQETINKSAFLKQIKNKTYYVGYYKVQIKPKETRTLKCLILNLKELQVSGIETYSIEKAMT